MRTHDSDWIHSSQNYDCYKLNDTNLKRRICDCRSCTEVAGEILKIVQRWERQAVLSAWQSFWWIVASAKLISKEYRLDFPLISGIANKLRMCFNMRIKWSHPTERMQPRQLRKDIVNGRCAQLVIFQPKALPSESGVIQHSGGSIFPGTCTRMNCFPNRRSVSACTLSSRSSNTVILEIIHIAPTSTIEETLTLGPRANSDYVLRSPALVILWLHFHGWIKFISWSLLPFLHKFFRFPGKGVMLIFALSWFRRDYIWVILDGKREIAAAFQIESFHHRSALPFDSLWLATILQRKVIWSVAKWLII